MTTYPNSPLLLKAGLVLVDGDTGAPQQVISLQYNPETLTRTLQVQGAGPEGGDHVEALRLKGPPVETLKLEAVLDAADQLEFPTQNPTATQSGLHPQLATLELLVYPPSSQILSTRAMAEQGVLEVVPMTAPLALFVWGTARIVPVRVTEFSITEELFDPSLNPIHVKVSLGMRVLSVNDLGFVGQGASLFMMHLQQKETLASMTTGTLAALGLQSVP
jgi:hypothetical protein